jgi:alkanesulfonate monooxygenase SsuD/methylene tetrahydromethanopterin reductase-like flavin-dependent oxidoreductase (luciferase family)
VTKFGLLLPHFGKHASPDLLLRGARRAEELGFDSLWVRDHLVFQPYSFEGEGSEFIEPFLTLTFVAGATDRIGLGTAVLTPHRHPLHMAQSVASLAWFARRRIDIAVGAGGAREFATIGLDEQGRPDLMREHIEIATAIWAEGVVSRDSDRYHFDNIQFRPVPEQPISTWWGGTAPASARLAVDYCNGWLPGRINFPTYIARLQQIRERAAQQGRPMIQVGVIPVVSIDRSRELAVRHIDVPAYLHYANSQRFWIKPASGNFASLNDLEGSVIAGTPDDVAATLARYDTIGCDLLIFDFRLRFADWLDQIEVVASEVLPRLPNGRSITLNS